MADLNSELDRIDRELDEAADIFKRQADARVAVVEHRIAPSLRKAAYAVLREVESSDQTYIYNVLAQHGLTGQVKTAAEVEVDTRSAEEIAVMNLARRKADELHCRVPTQTPWHHRRRAAPSTMTAEQVRALAKAHSARYSGAAALGEQLVEVAPGQWVTKKTQRRVVIE